MLSTLLSKGIWLWENIRSICFYSTVLGLVFFTNIQIADLMVGVVLGYILFLFSFIRWYIVSSDSHVAFVGGMIQSIFGKRNLASQAPANTVSPTNTSSPLPGVVVGPPAGTTSSLTYVLAPGTRSFPPLRARRSTDDDDPAVAAQE